MTIRIRNTSIVPAGRGCTVTGLLADSEDYARIWHRHSPGDIAPGILAREIEVEWRLQGSFTICVLTRRGGRGKHRRPFIGVAKRRAEENPELHRGMEISFSRAVQEFWRTA